HPFLLIFFFHAPSPTEFYTLSLHDALPISLVKDIVPGAGSSSPDSLTRVGSILFFAAFRPDTGTELWRSDGTEAGTLLVKDVYRSEEHTSELQSRFDLVCRLLLEKKKTKTK